MYILYHLACWLVGFCWCVHKVLKVRDRGPLNLFGKNVIWLARWCQQKKMSEWKWKSTTAAVCVLEIFPRFICIFLGKWQVLYYLYQNRGDYPKIFICVALHVPVWVISYARPHHIFPLHSGNNNFKNTHRFRVRERECRRESEWKKTNLCTTITAAAVTSHHYYF